MNSSRQIRRGAIMSYAAVFINMAAGLLYTPWMVKKIGQADYGLYSLVFTLISFFTIDFGLSEAVSRFLSKYNVENDDSRKRDFLGVTFKIYIAIDVLIFFALATVYIFADAIYRQLTPAELYKFRIAFCIAALFSVTLFPFMPLNGVLTSYERFVFQRFADLFNKILTIITMIAVLLLGYKLYALVLVNAITNLITVVIKLNYLHRNRLISVNFKSNDKLMLRAIFSFSFWTAIAAVAGRLVFNITPTILASVSGSIQVSLFAIAMAIEGYTWTFANALNGLFLPKVTRMILKNDEPKEVENLMIKVGRIQFFLVGLIIIAFLTMGKEFMQLWMGSKFLDSYYTGIFIIIPCVVTLTQQIGNTALVAVNEIRYRTFCTVATAGISIILTALFSPRWGAIGAGIAICIGSVIGNIVGINFVYYRVLRIDIFRFFKECHIKMIIPLIIMVCIGVLMQFIFPVQHLLPFTLKASVFGIVYIAFMWVLALNNSERILFADVLRRPFCIFRRKLSV